MWEIVQGVGMRGKENMWRMGRAGKMTATCGCGHTPASPMAAQIQNSHLLVIKTFQSALTCQVSEAVRIKTREKDKKVYVLSIKGTFNRCSLPSLALVQYDRVVSQETKTPDEEPTFSKTAANSDKRKGRGVKEENETGTNRPEKKRKLWRGGYKEGEEWGSQGLDKAVSEFLYR